jgi:hypothetical protein
MSKNSPKQNTEQLQNWFSWFLSTTRKTNPKKDRK